MPLKVLVIALGLVLIGGTIFVAATIAERVGKKKEADTTTATATMPASPLLPIYSSVCEPATITLPEGTIIKSVENHPQVTMLWLRTANDESKIIYIDPCSGKILNTLTATTNHGE